MSNIIPVNLQVPAHLMKKVGQPSALAQSMAGGITGGDSVPRISIKGSRFRIIEDGTETVLPVTTLEVIIVGANPRLSKTWYAKEWSKDAEPTAPDCFSMDGLSPDPTAAAPQNDLCASCKWNAWGSKIAPNGQQLKACADQKRLAVVAAEDPTGPVYLLQVTPAALKGLNNYQKELSTRGIPPEIVKTRVTFDTDASFPKLLFGFGGFIDEAAQDALDDLFGSDEVLRITGEKVDHPEPVTQAATPKVSVRAAAPTTSHPEPEPEPEPEQVEEPAKPKRGFGAAAAEPAKPKRGFGAASGAAEEPAAKATKATKAKAEPKAAASVNSMDDLASEIAALVSAVDDDDE